MKDNFIRSILILIILTGVILGAIYQLNKSKPGFTLIPTEDEYAQPALPVSKDGYWQIRSIDTQVISKNWENVSRESIIDQVKLIRELGVNYVAVATSYDQVDELRMWVEEIHKAGLHVWFRSHWLEWEGDNGRPATMTPDEYLSKTSDFIRINRDLFKPGDSFTMAVEPEQVGVGLGNRFLNWDDYRNFLLLQISLSNKAFKDIGLKQQIYTNWLSVNGWVVENEFSKDLVKKMGLITVDHFVYQTKTVGDYSDGDAVVEHTLADLDRFHKKWNVPVFLGEWGYQIFQQVPEDIQARVIENMFLGLRQKNYLVGINYWVHMGHNSKIINDIYGSQLTYRKAASVISDFFGPPVATPSATLKKEKKK